MDRNRIIPKRKIDVNDYRRGTATAAAAATCSILTTYIHTHTHKTRQRQKPFRNLLLPLCAEMALDGWQVVVCRRRAVVPRPFTYLSPTAPMPPLISPSLPYPTPSISLQAKGREGRRFAQCRACFRVSSALHLSAVRALCPLAP